jgi:hypothetical protein
MTETNDLALEFYKTESDVKVRQRWRRLSLLGETGTSKSLGILIVGPRIWSDSLMESRVGSACQP